MYMSDTRASGSSNRRWRASSRPKIPLPRLPNAATGYRPVTMRCCWMGAASNGMAPMAQIVVACALPIHAVLDAFRTGDGVPYADYGADLHEGQARFTQPMFDNLLATDWFPAVPAIHDRLKDDPPVRVADVACGLGRSSIAIARAYPKGTVDGIDLDRASIGRAQQLLAASGVDDRVAFHCRDAEGPELSGHL